MQYGPGDIGKLVNDASEEFPAHIRRRLEVLEGARTGLAQEIAAIGRLEIKANRLLFGDRAAGVADSFEVAARIGFSLGGSCHAVLRTSWYERISRRCRRTRI